MRESQNHVLVKTALVSFTDPDGISGSMNVDLETTTSTGVALFSSCKLGEHRFKVSAEGFEDEEAAIDFECNPEGNRIEKPILLTETCGCATVNLIVKYAQNEDPVTSATVKVEGPDGSIIIEEDTKVMMNGDLSFESCQIGTHDIKVSNKDLNGDDFDLKRTTIDIGCQTENFTMEETVFFTCGW